MVDQLIRRSGLPGIQRLLQGIQSKSVRMLPLTRQPTIRRTNTSMTKATYSAAPGSCQSQPLHQPLPDWLGSHVRMLEFFGGVPAIVVPDNLKSGVDRACRYEPEINRSYADLAAHYGMAVIPARPYKPQDKAKVEVGVQIVDTNELAEVHEGAVPPTSQVNSRRRSYSGKSCSS